MRHFPAIKRKRLAVLSLSLCLFRIWEWFVWRKWRRWCTMVPTGSWRRTRSWFVLGAQCCDIRQETEIFVRLVLCRPSLWEGLICCYIFFADLLLANRGKTSTHKRKSSAEREPRGKKRKKQENSEEKPAKKRPRTGDRREKRQDKQVAKRTKTRPKLNRKSPSKFKPQSRTKRKKQRWSRNWRCKNVNSS